MLFLRKGNTNLFRRTRQGTKEEVENTKPNIKDKRKMILDIHIRESSIECCLNSVNS